MFGILLWICGLVIGSAFYQPRAASVGIIGGADGPTAVFVTGKYAGFRWDIVLILLLLVIGILGFLRLRRCKRKQ